MFSVYVKRLELRRARGKEEKNVIFKDKDAIFCQNPERDTDREKRFGLLGLGRLQRSFFPLPATHGRVWGVVEKIEYVVEK